jgi:hypothetical protein
MSEPIASHAAPDEEPLYTDEDGIPTLFDVVIPGDQLCAAGVSLARPQATAAAHPKASAADLDQRIRAAIDAALPKVTERTAAAMRDALLQEVRNALGETERGRA